MKKLLAVITTIGIVGLAVFAWQASAEAQSTPMTEAHIQRIRANCVEAQSILTQLHASDALLRVNRGQLYESISTKLMAPFNSRVAVNKYNAAPLIEQSTKYEQQLNEFRALYKTYDETITRTLRMNCRNEPVAFYDSVAEARAKRVLVHQSVTKLHESILAYKVGFEAFAASIKEKTE